MGQHCRIQTETFKFQLFDLVSSKRENSLNKKAGEQAKVGCQIM